MVPPTYTEVSTVCAFNEFWNVPQQDFIHFPCINFIRKFMLFATMLHLHSSKKKKRGKITGVRIAHHLMQIYLPNVCSLEVMCNKYQLNAITVFKIIETRRMKYAWSTKTNIIWNSNMSFSSPIPSHRTDKCFQSKLTFLMDMMNVRVHRCNVCKLYTMWCPAYVFVTHKPFA